MTTLSRPLTMFERMIGFGGGDLPVCFATTARVGGPIREDDLRTALRKLQRRHPMLAVRAAPGADGSLWWTGDDVPELLLHTVAAGDEDGWIRVVLDELIQPFTLAEGPPVRFAWVQSERSSDLIAICHHAVADGLSGAFLMRDLLHYLGDPGAAVEPLPPLPPLEELALPAGADEPPPQPASASSALPPPTAEAFLAAAAGETGPPDFWLHAWRLEREETARLVRRARAEHVTVHDALGAAFLLAFADRYGGESGWQRTLQSPVNVRRLLAQPVGEDFGLFISLIKTSADCSPGHDLWSVARELDAGFRRERAPERLFALFGALRMLVSALSDGPDAMGAAVQSLAAQFTVDWDLSLSNLGRLDFPVEYGPLRLEALYGPTFSAGPGDRIVGVSTTDGRLHFTMLARSATMPPAEGRLIGEKAMALLTQSVETLGR